MSRYGDKLDDEGRRLVDVVRRNSARMARLIDDMLAFSRTGRQELRAVGVDMTEAVGRTPRIVKSGLHDEAFYRQMWATISTGGVWVGHFVNKRKDGTLFHEDATIFPVRDPAGRIINYAAVKRDVTQRMKAEERVRKLTRLYATLSRINETIVRAENREALFPSVCEGAVSAGRSALAWIGLVDEATGVVRPACWYGADDDYVKGLRIRVDDALEESGPTGTAVRANRVSYVNDYAADARVLPWRAEALRRGLRGAAALPLRAAGKAIGALTLYVDRPDFFDQDQLKLLEEIASDLSYALDGFEREGMRRRAEEGREAAQRKLRKALEDSVQAVASTTEVRDPYTAGHQRRVARLASAIAVEMGLPESQVDGIRFGCLIHDIGKLCVPAEILSRPTQLLSLELEMIRAHAQVGYEIVKDIEFPWPVARMILQHHERLDGSGYPSGLRGGDVITEARVLAVADVVEAMSSHRPYRAALGLDAALSEILAGRGVRYDAIAVDACVRLLRDQRFDLAG